MAHQGCRHCLNGYRYNHPEWVTAELCECSAKCRNCGEAFPVEESFRGYCSPCASTLCLYELTAADRELSSRMADVVAHAVSMVGR
jgi:hypothetical protein